MAGNYILKAMKFKKKKSIGILELEEYITIKSKNSVEGSNRKFNTAKKRISKMEVLCSVCGIGICEGCLVYPPKVNFFYSVFSPDFVKLQTPCSYKRS